MRVLGELPSLSLAVSDSRLSDILSLISSIPLPEAVPAPVVDDDEDAHLVSRVSQDCQHCCHC